MSTISSGRLNLQTLPTSPAPAEGGGAISSNFVALSNAISYLPWSGSTTYSINDVIQFTDKNYYIYINETPSSGIAPTDSGGATYWQMFSLSGSGAITGTSATLDNPSEPGGMVVQGTHDDYQFANIALKGDAASTSNFWYLSFRYDTINQLAFVYYAGGTSYVSYFTMTPLGHFLIGSTIDDGTNALQVSGSIAATYLKLTAGSAPTPASDGMIYFDGSSLYLHAAGTWKALAFA